MKRTHGSIVLISLLIVGGALAVPAGDAEAGWEIIRPRSPRHRHGDTVVFLPWGSRRVNVGRDTCYYHRGVYFKRHPRRGYVVITAPMGAVVPQLPIGHRTIIIDGVAYHEYDGVYYKGGPTGYTVVPISQAEPSAGAIVTATASTGSGTLRQTMVVNVPNNNGSYTPVTLQAAGNGTYLGPQGEVYPTQPTLAQLQAMYGK